MSAELQGKTAIVTGGGRGLGRSMALALARAGANVTITAARAKEQIDAVAKEAGGNNVLPLLADVSREEECVRVVAETVKRFSAVDILVNNAGRGMRFVSETFMTQPTRFWETDPAIRRMVIDTNINGPFLMARAVVPGMMQRRWGRIINISANHETMRRRGFSPYGPSKAALEAESIVWAQDLEGTGVTVNELLPGGATRTGMVPDDVPESIQKKLLDPLIMGAPLVWLASAASANVSGKRINAARWDPAQPLVAFDTA
jgi:NAD(P)-dependent dehydrogenase (short-subunit alcohol dehydrogenase family)